MFVGHYSVSFAAKRAAPTLPLWVLFLAVQLLDVAWSILVLFGVEKVRIVPGITAASPLDLYYMPYTHSLPAALIWSVGAALAFKAFRRDTGTAALALLAVAVFSHWLLDLVVHRPDLALWDDGAKVGLGLWNHPLLAFALEVCCLFCGVMPYLRARVPRPRGILLFCLAMLAIQAYVFFGPPPVSPNAIALTALGSYLGFAAVAGYLERPIRTA